MLGTTRRAHQGDHRICLNFSSETSLFSFWQNSSLRRRSESHGKFKSSNMGVGGGGTNHQTYSALYNSVHLTPAVGATGSGFILVTGMRRSHFQKVGMEFTDQCGDRCRNCSQCAQCK